MVLKGDIDDGAGTVVVDAHGAKETGGRHVHVLLFPSDSFINDPQCSFLNE